MSENESTIPIKPPSSIVLPIDLGLKASKWFVLPIIFGQMLNYGIMRPSLPQITVSFFDNSVSEASLISGIADAAGALLAFFIMPILGSYSDIYGRRPILILTLIFTSFPVWIIMGYPLYTSLWLFFAAQIIAKLSTFSSVYAYIADITSVEERSTAYGQVSAVVFLALTAGPAIAKFVPMEISFKIAGLISLVNICYSIFIMPDSINPANNLSEVQPIINGSTEKDAQEHELAANKPRSGHVGPFITLKFMFRNRLYSIIFLMVIFEQFAVYGINEIFLLYLMATVGFDREDNIHLGIMGSIATCCAMLLLLPILSKKLGEKRLIVVCIVLYLLYTICYLFVRDKWQVYSLLCLSVPSALSYPATGSLLSMFVAKQEMGLAQGALSGIRSLSLGVGPLIFAVLFSLFTREGISYTYPQAPFVLAALLTLISFFIAIRIPDPRSKDTMLLYSPLPSESPEEEETEEENNADHKGIIMPEPRSRSSSDEYNRFLAVKNLNKKTLVK
jgi:DHA1 family tetracycline resistance protein-like MFS transporter